MSDLNKRKSGDRRPPSFSVQDELKRNRQLRRSGTIRQARTATHKVFTLVVCVAVFVITFAAIFLAVTRVDSVTVSGNYIYSADELIGAADINGAVLPFLSKGEIGKRIISACPYVNSIDIEKQYPTTVKIVVNEAKPVYVADIRDNKYLLDSSLRVMGINQNADGLIELSLPEVSRAIEGSVVEFYEEKSTEMVPRLLQSLFDDENSLQFTAIDLTRRFHISATIGDSFKIKLGDSNHIPVKLSVAQQIIKKANEMQSKRTYMDISKLMDDKPPLVIFDYEYEF